MALRPLLFPVARPYVVGGLASGDLENPTGLAMESSGAFTGVGVDLALVGFRLFAEGRYEFLDGEVRQAVVRAGVLF